MKCLLTQIENLIAEKAEDHIDATHSYDNAPKAKAIVVRDIIESATENMAEALVEAFAMPTISDHI